MNPKSRDNLRLWKKGESGNPAGPPKGKPYSIVNAMKKMWSSDGVLTLSTSEIIEQTDDHIKIKLPKTDMIALRVAKIMMSKNETAAMNAIKFATQYMDGMPDQKLDIEATAGTRIIAISGEGKELPE